MRVFLIKIFIALIILSGFLYINSIMVDPDLGWHLKVGEKILADRDVPRLDEFSWTMPKFEWVDHEWLVDAALEWTYGHNAWNVTIILFSLLAATPFFIWIWRSQNLIQLWITILAAISIMPFIGVRPQIISFLSFFIIFELLYRLMTLKNSKNKIILFSLPVIFFVWANLHAGFFIGLVLFGLIILLRSVLNIYNFRKISFKDNFYLMAVFILSVATTFINPYSWRLYKEIFNVISSSETMKYIAEWQMIFYGSDLSFILFIGIFLALLAFVYNKYDKIWLLVSSFFLMMAIKSFRNWPLFLVVAMPTIFLGVELAWKEITIARQEKIFNKNDKNIFNIFQIIIFICIFIFFGYRLKSYKPTILPEKAINLISQEIQSGRWKDAKLLNSYGWGGYLINNISDVKTFIDGRMPHWIDRDGNSAMKDYIKIFYSDDHDDWKEVFSRRGINVVLIENEFEAVKEKSFLEKYFPKCFEKIRYFLRGQKTIVKIHNILSSEKELNLKNALLENGWHIEYQDEVSVILRNNQ